MQNLRRQEGFSISLAIVEIHFIGEEVEQEKLNMKNKTRPSLVRHGCFGFSPQDSTHRSRIPRPHDLCKIPKYLEFKDEGGGGDAWNLVGSHHFPFEILWDTGLEKEQEALPCFLENKRSYED